MHWTGIALGLFSAFMIGTGFMWVIRMEYYMGAYLWKWVALAGLAVVGASLFMPNFISAAIVGVIGGSVTWGAMELPHQEERVEHGLFKAHPNRASRPKLKQGMSGSGGAHSHGSKPGLGKWWSF